VVLAQRLQADLAKRGFDAWLDSQRIGGGAIWTKDIETAMDEAEYVLALLTDGSYVSDICRAEQLRALRKGKCVIQLKAQEGVDVPLHLEGGNYRDFSRDGQYAQTLEHLLADLHAHKGSQLRKQFRTTYVTAPPLPVNFVERSEAVEALRNSIITDEVGNSIALTALEGMGGIGKTVLAQALCRDEVVQEAFPDGIIWVTIGKESIFDVLTRMREVGKALGDDLSRYDNILGATNQYRSTIRSKAVLIVVDDVWDVNDLDPFRAESSPRSRLLFTTRDKNIAAVVGAREYIANLLTYEQSREVLARWSRTPIASLPPLADDLIQECGRLPLALSMAGAMLSGKPQNMWKRVHDLLRKADLDKIAMDFPGYRYPNLLSALQVSVNELDPVIRERYLGLSVLLEDMSILPIIQQCLWNVDEFEATETAAQLLSLSLAQPDSTEGSIRLHDLQLDYVRAHYPDREALELIHEAMRYLSGVIAKDPAQFAGQLVGRLLALSSQPTVSQLLNRLSESVPLPWLRPLFPALKGPAGEYVRTLKGHTGDITAVAVTPDGRHAVSASRDRTLKVWDLEAGRNQRTLVGHISAVLAVAVTGDGKHIISGSAEGAVKVWDLESGCELRSFVGHTGAITAIAVLSDRYFVSSSFDTTVKVWELESGRELRTLSGHKYFVNTVAVTRDGKHIVSGSFDRAVKLWDSESGRELRTFAGHKFEVCAVAVMPDGKHIVSGSRDDTVKLWDVESGRELRTFGHKSAINALAVTPDGLHAVSASYDGTVRVWDIESGSELRTLGHKNEVRAVTVTPDGKYIVSASDQMLKLWNLNCEYECLRARHKGAVYAVIVTPDGQHVISASYDRTIKVWDIESGRELRTLGGHDDTVAALAMTPDGQLLISGSWDKTMKIWDWKNGRELRTLARHVLGFNELAVTPDGRRVISGNYHEAVRVWDLASGAELRRFKVPKRGLISLSHCGRYVFSVSEDGTKKIFDSETKRRVGTIKGRCQLDLAVMPDGQRVITLSSQRLTLRELKSGRELRSFGGHISDINTMAVTPNGRRAVSASDDRTIRIWDLENGILLSSFTFDDSVLCCRFARTSGDMVVAGDKTGAVHFLRLEHPRTR
jgi:WD40 repeat protein